MKLILHADDFGYTKSINEAIIELSNIGALTSVSVMANMPYTFECEELKSIKSISIGLHSTFTQGKPLSNPDHIKSLVNDKGEFLSYDLLSERVKNKKISVEEIKVELRKQFNTIKEVLGNRLTMIDCHHGLHIKLAPFRKAFISIGKELNIPIIRTAPQYYIVKGVKSNSLIKPYIGNIHKFGVRKVLVNYFRMYLIWRFSKVYKMADGMIVSFKTEEKNILKEIIKINFIKQKSSKLFFVELHPATSIKGLTETDLKEQRVDEYNFLKSSRFSRLIDKVDLINFNEIL